MATNATIASQITRISNSRNILRDKGIALKLYVPAGTYWDDATDKDITTTVASALKDTDQIDKVAGFKKFVVDTGDYKMRYKNTTGEPFDWLYIDFDTLSMYAEEYGFKCEKCIDGEHYDYLARITPGTAQQ